LATSFFYITKIIGMYDRIFYVFENILPVLDFNLNKLYKFAESFSVCSVLQICVMVNIRILFQVKPIYKY